MSFWINDHTALFYIEPDGPVFLKCISVDKVDLLNGEIILSGMLPHSIDLNGIQNGDLLEVLNQRSGDSRDRYDPSRVILRFSHCRVLEKAVFDVIALKSEQVDIVRLRVKLAADIQVLAEEVK